MEEPEKFNKNEWHTLQRIILSVFGFLLSIVFISCGMFMLVRFWLITHIYYLVYMLSTIFIGILFTIFSSNLFLYTEVMTNKTIWPYFWLTPMTILWTIIGILLPIYQDGYYSKYSKVPVLTYSQAFYDGDAYNETTSKDHPFGAAYKHESRFFNNQEAIVVILIILLVVQILFWFMAVCAYIPIVRDFWKNKNVKVL